MQFLNRKDSERTETLFGYSSIIYDRLNTKDKLASMMIFGASLTSSWNLSQTSRLAQHTIIYYDCQYKLHIFAPVSENKQRLAGTLSLTT
jgi:hypothetical protein